MRGAAEFFSVQATSSAADHLRKAHRITPASQSSESSPGDEGVIDIYSGATPKRRRLEQSAIPRAKIKAIQELSVGFVIDSDVPFTIFEHSFLRKIFNHFDSDLVLQMAWSGSSVTREIHRLFEAKRDIIKAEHLSLQLKKRKTGQDGSRRRTYCPAKTGGFLAKSTRF
ncbi:hypothetical protein BFJ70_g16932 [Fusarium oxysporum]|nr:hypothetical protein BFJ70_g16932 [Fusarium oxysporum]